LALIAQDNFTEATSALLENHTPDTGTAWVVEDPAHPLTVSNNQLMQVGNNRDRKAYETTNIGDDDMNVSVTAHAQNGGTDRGSGLLFRASTSVFQDNHYLLELDGRSDIVLQKNVGGTTTEIAAVAVGTNFGVVAVSCRATKTCYFDGSAMIITSDDVLTGNNWAGVKVEGSAEDKYVDNFKCDSVGGAPAPAVIVDQSFISVVL